ncbi:MAG: PEGA domain-containing protein [Methanomicrobiales archaeon]|nr:PEGA domain-containing protein [Methanomicrobiales archaeon]
MIIDSIPSGARVFIDGSAAGTTPFTSESVATGDHTILLTLAGYADFPSTGTVPPGGVFHETYTLSCNVLIISSDPSGSSVSVDSTAQGTTPTEVREITAGEHTVTLSLDGYETFTTTVNVPPGAEVSLHNMLAPSRAVQQVTTSPTGSRKHQHAGRRIPPQPLP